MPRIQTASGFQNRILEANPNMNKRYAQRLAVRLKRRADRMQEEFDFYQELRILGIVPDPTALEAVKSLEYA